MTEKPCFIHYLYDMLDDPEHSNAISWCEDGKSFTILDDALLQKNVLPLYFNHGVLNSFIRQLSNYGFSRRKKHPGLAFYHNDNLFQRGRPELVSKIVRRKQLRPNRYENARKRTQKIKGQSFSFLIPPPPPPPTHPQVSSQESITPVSSTTSMIPNMTTKTIILPFTPHSGMKLVFAEEVPLIPQEFRLENNQDWFDLRPINLPTQEPNIDQYFAVEPEEVKRRRIEE